MVTFDNDVAAIMRVASLIKLVYICSPFLLLLNKGKKRKKFKETEKAE